MKGLLRESTPASLRSKRVHDPFERIRVVQRMPVRAYRRSVGDDVAIILNSQPAIVAKPVQGAAALAFAIVHRSKPQSSATVDVTIIEPIAFNVSLNLDFLRDLARARIEPIETARQTTNQVSVFQRRNETRLIGHRPAIFFAAFDKKGMHLPALDIDEVHRALFLAPNWSLAKFGADRPNAI